MTQLESKAIYVAALSEGMMLVQTEVNLTLKDQNAKDRVSEAVLKAYTQCRFLKV